VAHAAERSYGGFVAPPRLNWLGHLAVYLVVGFGVAAFLASVAPGWPHVLGLALTLWTATLATLGVERFVARRGRPD
jgi:membrane protein implicated in regulation of membrane protease activity